MSVSSFRPGIGSDDINSCTGQSVANFETNWDDKDLINWQLPNIQQNSIYKKKLLDFRTLLDQKTKEINVKFQNNTFSTNLLNKNSLTHYNKIGFNYLHIGSVQVGVKPLSKIGLNNSLLIVLRDKRITDYKESILGMAETSLTYGPIYFQVYPKFTIALNTDEHKEKCLVIDIQTHNYKILEKNSPYKLVYRVHYRVLTSGLIPSYIPPSVPAGQTICFNASPSVNVLVPVPVKWENIKFPDDWVKEKVNQPSYKPHMRNLHDCVTEQDGTLKISFRNSLSIRDNDSDHSRSLNDFQSARNSISSLSRQNIARQIPSLAPEQNRQTTNLFPTPNYDPEDDSSEPINLVHRRRRPKQLTHVTHVQKTPEQIAQPIHSYNQDQTSPTPSQVLTEILEPEPPIRTINVTSKNNLDFLIADYHSVQNSQLREKYEKNYSQIKRKQFHERWIKSINHLDQNISFFYWYVDRKNYEQNCSVINKQNLRTYKTKKGDERQLHPPPRNFEINMPNDDNPAETNVTECTPFIIFDEPLSYTTFSSSHQIGLVMKQGNYTNFFLNSIGEQLEKIDLNLTQTSISPTKEDLPPQVFVPYNVPSSSNKGKEKMIKTEPILFPDHTGIEKCFDNLIDEAELLRTLEERLGRIPSANIQTIDKTIPDSDSSDSNSETPSFQDYVQRITTNEKTDSYNKTKYFQNTKPYYPKPTPPDLQYEETVPYRAYTGNACYQFNIDGLS
ncbi:hypothetical protein Ddye_007817 [Dipteronia dyeriana]|uniref:DUF7588 domain-containing protein n=1 Tax=Dipteronia dyeriana TaxID=168575 RepID=A0AAE0CS16_9ROSI|nr:hypothetical protein Ddye_007817 [Dipteronia dyeriana]